MQSYYTTYRFFPSAFPSEPYNYYTQPLANYYQPYMIASQNFVPFPQPMQPMPSQYYKQTPGILQAFMNENGSFDFVKTAQTVDQMMKTVNQVVPLVKQFSSIFQAVGK